MAEHKAQVTPDMIEAGHRAYQKCEIWADGAISDAHLIDIYHAMLRAQVSPPSAPTSREPDHLTYCNGP